MFRRKPISFSTEAGNQRAAKIAAKAAKKARQAGDHEDAERCEAFAAEALRQAEYSKRLGR